MAGVGGGGEIFSISGEELDPYMGELGTLLKDLIIT